MKHENIIFIDLLCLLHYENNENSIPSPTRKI